MIGQRLSEILNKDYGVPEASIEEVQAEPNGDAAELLLKKQIVSETQLLEAYSKLYDIPYVPKLPVEEFNMEFARKVSIQFLKKYIMIPLESERDRKSVV